MMRWWCGVAVLVAPCLPLGSNPGCARRKSDSAGERLTPPAPLCTSARLPVAMSSPLSSAAPAVLQTAHTHLVKTLYRQVIKLQLNWVVDRSANRRQASARTQPTGTGDWGQGHQRGGG